MAHLTKANKDGKNVHWYEAATMEQSVVFAQIGNSCIPRRGQPYVEAAITETWEYNAVKILSNKQYFEDQHCITALLIADLTDGDFD